MPSAFAAAAAASSSARRCAGDVRVVPHVVRATATAPGGDPQGPALVASRLAPEKGVDMAIDACRAVGLPLVVAGDGPLAGELRARAAGADVTFAGRVDATELARLRAAASVAIVPVAVGRDVRPRGGRGDGRRACRWPPPRSARSAELVPRRRSSRRRATRGALGELALRLRGDRDAAAAGLERVRAVAAPEVVAPLLAAAYDG